MTEVKGKGLGLESRYPRQFSGLYNYLPWLWNSHVYCLVSLGRMQPCSIQRQRLYTIHNILFPFHQVPITAGWPEAVWIQSLPKASTHDQRLGNRTPDPIDIGSYALTTRSTDTKASSMRLIENLKHLMQRVGGIGIWHLELKSNARVSNIKNQVLCLNILHMATICCGDLL